MQFSTGGARIARTRPPLFREGVRVGSGRGSMTHAVTVAVGHGVTTLSRPGKSRIHGPTDRSRVIHNPAMRSTDRDTRRLIRETSEVTAAVSHAVTGECRG